MKYTIYYLIVSISFCSCATLVAGRLSPAALHNPVLEIDFPDPTIISAEGLYYAHATQASYRGKMNNIQVAVSPDLFHWKYAGDALPRKPAWATHTQDFWAPHVLYDRSLQQYVLFFSAKSNDTATDKCIGVAFSSSPAGPFIDKGSPLLSGQGFEDIDPMAIIDSVSGKKLLYWGSGSSRLRFRK